MKRMILENGDYQLNEQGLPNYTSDEKTILQQQIVLALTCPKGKFIYNPNFGLDLSQIGQNEKENEEMLCLQYVQSAVSHIPHLFIKEVHLEKNKQNKVESIYLSYRKETFAGEVTIFYDRKT